MKRMKERVQTGWRVDTMLTQYCKLSSGTRLSVHFLFDLVANARFLAAYIPSSSSLIDDAIEVLEFSHIYLADLDTSLARAGTTKLVLFGDSEPYELTNVPFSGRVFLYFDEALREHERERISCRSAEIHLSPIIRDLTYLAKLDRWEKPTLFISHDSRDKEAIAKPLTNHLQKTYRYKVWLDAYTLQVGDSLRSSIERGLKECKVCVVILTPAFLANTGWTKKEFDSVFTREIVERDEVIFPVWSGITPREVYEYSPSLADRVGANWDDGIVKVAQQIHSALDPSTGGRVP